MLAKLQLYNIRNLSELTLNFSQGINLITGPNGSGKSSILESIFYLSRGRSFRTANSSIVISENASKFIIVTQLKNGILLASERSKNGKVTHKINGIECSSMLEVSEHLPLLFLDTDSQRWLASGPKNRRQIIDWGLFYGRYKDFYHVWRNFRRCLLQRNAALKVAELDFRIWDNNFITYATQLNHQREVYVRDLQDVFVRTWQILGENLGEISINYQPGWVGDLSKALESAYDRDRCCGYSNFGPHRADLSIKVDGKLAHTYLSQGQQKLLTYAITVAQAELYKIDSGTNCLLLLDDLCAELDLEKRSGIIEFLMNMEHQIVITGVVANEITNSFSSEYNHINLLNIDYGNIAYQ